METHGTEEEVLSDFIIQILHRELLEDCLNRVPAGSGQKNTVQRMKLLATRTVAQRTAKTWKLALNMVTPVLKKMSGTSQEILFDEESGKRFQSISQVEDRVRVRLTAAVGRIVDPVLIDVATNFCAPLLASIVGSIAQAYNEAITGFESEMQQFLVDHADNLGDERAVLLELNSVHRRVSHLSGPFTTPRDTLWDMYTTKCSDLLNDANSGLDAFDLYCEICDSLRKVLHNGVHHMGELLLQSPSASSGTSPRELLAQVLAMMTTGVIGGRIVCFLS